MAPLFSNNSKASNKITLYENEKLIINDQKCAEVFNNYFNSIVKELNIPIDQNLLNDAYIFDDPIIAAVHKYKRHPSILKIKNKTFKRCLYYQIYEYIDTISSKVQRGFGKGFSTQYSLIALIEKMKKKYG